MKNHSPEGPNDPPDRQNTFGSHGPMRPIPAAGGISEAGPGKGCGPTSCAAAPVIAGIVLKSRCDPKRPQFAKWRGPPQHC